MMLSNS